jgi:hypothetical protein
MPLLEPARGKRFIYLIQDFERGFYACSSNHALALETYSMPFLRVINEATFADFPSGNRAARFAPPAARQSAIVMAARGGLTMTNGFGAKTAASPAEPDGGTRDGRVTMRDRPSGIGRVATKKHGYRSDNCLLSAQNRVGFVCRSLAGNHSCSIREAKAAAEPFARWWCL